MQSVENYSRVMMVTTTMVWLVVIVVRLMMMWLKLNEATEGVASASQGFSYIFVLSYYVSLI